MNIHCRKCSKFLFVDPNGIEVTDAICFTCDNPSMEAIAMSVDPDVSVYAVPVEIDLKAEVYVLARSAAEARVEAIKLDLDDIFSGDDESYFIDGTDRANMVEAEAKWVTGDTKEATPRIMAETEYKVTDHPDYNSADHDEVDEDAVDPGRPEGMRS